MGEGATFQCLDYAPSGLGQEVLSPGDDEYADAEEHSATTDLEMKRYIVRYGTYGTFADTGTHKYDDAWFEDPAHAGDIEWTYGSETLEPSLGASENDVSSSHDDHHEFLVQSNVDVNDRGVDVLLTNLGVGCVAASASIFVFVAARRLVASGRAGGGYERVPEPELDL